MIADNTPVLVGAGQFTERLDDPDYQGFSAVEIAARSAQVALNDCGANSIGEHIDLISTTRTFEDSTPLLAFPFGRSNNFPRSVCLQLGINPAYAIWSAAGGDSPQRLVSEACERIARGDSRAAVVCGAEAISTARHLMKQGIEKDWSATVDAQVEDRGTDGLDMVTQNELRHGLMAAPPLYGLLENARRARQGLSRGDYAQSMGALFAPFTEVASRNPFSSMANRAYSADELVGVSTSNRIIADPYPRLLVARDQVNQGAAVVVIAAGLARELGIPENQWVYLHGYGHASERPLMERPDLGASPAARAALDCALEHAGVDVDQLSLIDLYSCFPIAVSQLCDHLGLAANDPRHLTLTGGLPYFGGPGNNYSMHALAEVVKQLRDHPGQFGLVSANGGLLSKHAVGVYSTTPRAFTARDCKPMQQRLDAEPAVDFSEKADGAAQVETYTLIYNRGGDPEVGIIVGRMTDSGARFTAKTAKDDSVTPQWMRDHDPLGAKVIVTANTEANHFRIA